MPRDNHIKGSHSECLRGSRQRKVRAFTLLELLSVIFITAVLAALLFPVMQRGLDASNRARCVSNLRTLATGIGLYVAENNGNLPPAHSVQGTGADVTHPTWADVLQDGRGPAKGGGGVLPNPNTKNSSAIKTPYNCPANPFRTKFWYSSSYVYNQALGDEADDPPVTVRLGRIPQPSRVLMLADAAVRFPNDVSIQQGPPYSLWTITLPAQWNRTSAPPQISFDLHGGDMAKFKSGDTSIGKKGYANFLMVDGHVETMKYDEANRRFNDLTLLWSPDNTNGYW